MAQPKIKSPPKSTGGEVLALLKLTSDRRTLGYGTKMSNLINFLNATGDIRTGAEVVEHDLNIDKDGKVLHDDYVKQDFINDKMRSVHFHVEDEKELRNKLSGLYEQMRQKSDIIRLKKYKEDKKEIARVKLEGLKIEKEEVRETLNELQKKIEGLKDEERKRLEAIDFPIQTMREKFELFTGCKIRIDLTTGSYVFPVPTGTPFYQQICNLLGLPLENQEPVSKPVVKRVFTMPAEVLETIKRAMHFVSTDDLRPAMTCVSLDIKNNKLIVVATDAHRLFKSRVFDITGPKGSYNYLLPATALKRLPKAVKEDFCFYEIKDGKASMLGLTVDLLDARYPDWRVVVPQYKTGVTFKREEFMTCVKQVSVFANKSTHQVNIDINGSLAFAAQDIDFSFESGVRMAYKKKDMPDTVIGFNGKFLVETLKTFKSDEIKMLSEGSPTKAGIFTDGIDEVLIMPLMIAGY